MVCPTNVQRNTKLHKKQSIIGILWRFTKAKTIVRRSIITGAIAQFH